MIYYAVTLEFDKGTQTKIQELIDEVAMVTGCDYMKRFANIGVFNPYVIYLGPVMNEFLQNTCRTVNESLLKHAEVGNKGNYLPNQWVPHAGIAVKLTPEALKEAFAIVQAKFNAFGATAERIVLAKAEPYEELCAWELKEE